MKHKSIYTTILCLLHCALLVNLASCGKEDDVVVNLKDTSFYFMPNDTCTDEESVLRREFFYEHGSYLLFNDTIQHYFVGIDINGDSAYFTELLQLDYNVGEANQHKTYTFTLLPSLTRKKDAIEFVEERILYHFTNDLQPFSWILVNKITYTYGLTTSNPTTASGQRAFAVALGDLPYARTETQKTNLAQQILVGAVNNIVTTKSAKFKNFTDISRNLYSQYFTGYEDATTNQCLEYLNSKGLLSRGKDPMWGRVSNSYYPSESTDMSDYAQLVVVNDIETIRTRYANYPLIIEKAETMIGILESIGYVF